MTNFNEYSGALTCCMNKPTKKLIAMKLFGLAAALKDRLERRDHQDLSKTEFLGLPHR